MQNSVVKKAIRGAVISFAVLFIAVAGIKLLSMRTYDPDNPRSRPNGYLMSHTVKVNRAPAKVFDFITYKMKDHNLSIAEAHEKIRFIQGNGLTTGAVFIAEEFLEDEGVAHRYEVREVVPDQMIYYSSTPSRIFKKSNGEMKPAGSCNCYVYFDLKESAGNTLLTQTLVIEMPNFFTKFIIDLITATKEDNEWQAHLEEELAGLKEKIEQYSS